MKRRGASVPVTKATACEPLLPSPHPGPSPASLRPPPPPLFCFHGDKRRGPAPNITRCGKHAPRGTPPPAACARGRALRGPSAVPATCRSARAPRAGPDARDPLLPACRFSAVPGLPSTEAPRRPSPRPEPPRAPAAPGPAPRHPAASRASLRPRPRATRGAAARGGRAPGSAKRGGRCFRDRGRARWRRPWSSSAGLGAGGYRPWTWTAWRCW